MDAHTISNACSAWHSTFTLDAGCGIGSQGHSGKRREKGDDLLSCAGLEPGSFEEKVSALYRAGVFYPVCEEWGFQTGGGGKATAKTDWWDGPKSKG